MKTVYFGGGVLERVYTADLREKVPGERITPEELAKNPRLCADAQALFTSWGMPHYTVGQIREYFPELKYLFYGAGSVQGFAGEFLQCGVRVFSAWAANAVPVAEFTCAQIILAGKRYFDLFAGGKAAPRGNYQSSVGLIGLGMIGSMVARRLQSTDLKLYAYDAFRTEEECEALRVTKITLPELFSRCDVISNHLANNAQTRGMINSELLCSMKPDAAFINTGRGAQVDHAGLYEALRSSPDRICLLDVTDPEPLPVGHPLLSLKNVIVSPHIAGSLGGEVARMGEYMREEYERLSSGLPAVYEVTVESLRYMA